MSSENTSPERATLGSSGVVYECGRATKGAVTVVEALLSESIINSRSFSTPFRNNIAIACTSGSLHSLALTPDGDIYSWGEGKLGELGLGIVVKSTTEPKRIKFNAKFAAITCSDVHNCVLDEQGNAYTWGQNNSRQLGLYNFSKTDMKAPSCLVEDFVFAPRFLPFSLRRPSSPVTKVACGPRFTVALTAAGKVWTWGAGDCGQLGHDSTVEANARRNLALKEVPSPVAFPSPSATDPAEASSDCLIVDVCAGYGHVLALTSEGRIFGWGLNAKHQLGLGDAYSAHSALHAPTLVSYFSADACRVCKVYANAHSSACIDAQGRLFTWGSNASDKLLQRDPLSTHFSQPTQVHALAGARVHAFALNADTSAAFVQARLSHVSPAAGPSRALSSMTIHGCGFFPSSDCIVRFKSLAESRHPPRSCIGQVVSGFELVCVPPRLPLSGEYQVSLSLNGKDFLLDTASITTYQEPSVVSIEPKLVDVSNVSAAELVITLKKFSLPVGGKLTLRLSAYSLAASTKLGEVDVELGIDSVLDEGSAGTLLARVACPVDLAPLLALALSQAFSLRVSVSLNSQDFSAPSSASVLCHACIPRSVRPNCVSLSARHAAIKASVLGEGFPHTSSAEATVVLEPVSLVSEQAPLVARASSAASTVLAFSMPSEDQLSRLIPVSNDSLVFPLSLRVEINGVAVGGAGVLVVHAYRPAPMVLSTSAYRRGGGTVLRVTSACMAFDTDSAKLRVSAPRMQDKLTPLTLRLGDGDDGMYVGSAVAPSLSDEADAGDKVFVSVLLDGESSPPEEHAVEMSVFTELSGLACKNLPKAGFVSGATVVCTVQGLIAVERCRIRLGGSDGQTLECEGAVHVEEGSLSFALPDDLASLAAAEVKGKTKYYYVHVSIDDGSTFDRSDTPIIALKG